MARPRFLDKVSAAHAADLEALIRKGATIDRLLSWCVEQEIDVSRSTLANHRNAILGSEESKDPTARVKARVEAAAAEPRAPRPEQVAEAPEEGTDHRRLLLDQLEAAKTISAEETDPKDRIAAAKLVLQLSKELQEMERTGAAGRGPQVIFYFPQKVRIVMDDDAA